MFIIAISCCIYSYGGTGSIQARWIPSQHGFHTISAYTYELNNMKHIEKKQKARYAIGRFNYIQKPVMLRPIDASDTRQSVYSVMDTCSKQDIRDSQRLELVALLRQYLALIYKVTSASIIFTIS